MNTEVEARKRGEAALAEMGDAGAGWTLVLWNNLGWWVKLVSPCKRIKVIPAVGCPGLYVAYLSEPSEDGGRWTGTGTTPQEAATNAVAAGRRALAEIQGILAGL